MKIFKSDLDTGNVVFDGKVLAYDPAAKRVRVLNEYCTDFHVVDVPLKILYTNEFLVSIKHVTNRRNALHLTKNDKQSVYLLPGDASSLHASPHEKKVQIHGSHGSYQFDLENYTCDESASLQLGSYCFRQESSKVTWLDASKESVALCYDRPYTIIGTPIVGQDTVSLKLFNSQGFPDTAPKKERTHCDLRMYNLKGELVCSLFESIDAFGMQSITECNYDKRLGGYWVLVKFYNITDKVHFCLYFVSEDGQVVDFSSRDERIRLGKLRVIYQGGVFMDLDTGDVRC
ncbi:hypothetical protein SAMN02745181_0479 [Rubritalea squalenifaciens DSM 18772]|uniref:Uncharacterized protein n=1 Tax=Rubritalea squalenifaciens DSM 18772 TaxID=1123071 RepID=A0A1M6CHK6_9BACT|nr:hypothetical protein [Rubritalea squalenifaciens]SHI60341.1 hypothetical protein SAMN02745181_0479 [Rubritalea squalenifaciens DSM 18772]